MKTAGCVAAIVAIAIVMAGCAGRMDTREVLLNPEDATVMRWVPLGHPVRCATSSVDEILHSGRVRIAVAQYSVPERHWVVARYRIEQTHYYFGPGALSRCLGFPLYLVLGVPFDLLLAVTHPSLPFPLFRLLFALDVEWEPLPRIEERTDVTRLDTLSTSATEPLCNARCDLVVRLGSTHPHRAQELTPITSFQATTDERGECEFDLRGLAAEAEPVNAGWTLTFELYPGRRTDVAPPLVLSAEQVRSLGSVK